LAHYKPILAVSPGMMASGQGDAMRAEGIDATNPANKEAVIRWQLRYAKQHGWGEWYGAASAGIGRWQGIGGLGGRSDGNVATQIGPLAGDLTGRHIPLSGGAASRGWESSIGQ
jgi:hypothetical protein